VDERFNRHDLADKKWALLESSLPTHPRQGQRWTDHRTVINGVFHRTRAGTPWRDLPERYGNCKTVYNRHRRWSADGTWERLLDGLRAGADAAGAVDWTVSVDSTVARAHQHAADARRTPSTDLDTGGHRR
jgi:transposase